MRTTEVVLAVLASALMLSADCGVRAADAETSSAPGVTTLTCADDAIVPMRLGHLLNNTWNKRLAGSEPWQQCLRSRVVGGKTEYGWDWKWPRRDGIYAYPEVLVGRSPWTTTPSNDTRFPRRIADTRSLRVDFEVESRFDGKRNLALEMWLTRTAVNGPAAIAGAITTELMIWSDASKGMISAKDAPSATVEIDGARWALYVHRNWGDVSGGSAQHWTFLTYIAMAPSLSGHYDARKFLADAIERRLVDASDFISDVELGNEIVSGVGSTWLRQFDLTVDPADGALRR